MVKIEKINDQIVVNDNGNIIHINSLKFTSDGYLKIPENSSNRTLVKYSKIENLGDGEFYELKDKVEKIFSGENHGKISQKSLIEYLTEEEKSIYNELMENAKKRHEEDHKKVPLSQEEKLRRRIEKAQKELEELMKNQ